MTTTPFIISLPFRLKEPIVVRQATSNVDVWPTLLEMLGLPGLDGADGRSLLPALIGNPDATVDRDRLQFAQLDRTWGQVQRRPTPTYAVNDESWRLIRGAETNRGDMLFNRLEDPAERSDVAAENPEIVSELGSRLEDYLKQDSAFDEVPRVELNDMELRQLRALGYAVE